MEKISILSLLVYCSVVCLQILESSGSSIIFSTGRELPSRYRLRKRNSDETPNRKEPQSVKEISDGYRLRVFGGNISDWESYEKHLKDETDRLMARYSWMNWQKTTETPYWMRTTESYGNWRYHDETTTSSYTYGHRKQQQRLGYGAIMGIIAGVFFGVAICYAVCCSKSCKQMCRAEPETNLAAQEALLHPTPIVVYPSQTYNYPTAPIAQPVDDYPGPVAPLPRNLSHQDSLPTYTEAVRNSPLPVRVS